MEKILLAIKQILDGLKAADTAKRGLGIVRRVIIGNPVLIPASSLPIIAIYPQSTRVTGRGVQYDQADSVIKIKLVQNVKNFLGDSDAKEILDLEINAIRIFEDRDSLEKIAETSIIGALRKNYDFPYEGNPTCEWNGDYDLSFDWVNMENWVAFESTLSVSVKKLSDRL